MKNRKLVMIPGPTPVVRSIQNEMGRETVAFGDPTFVKDYKETIEDLKKLFDCDGEVFLIAGTGTLAMEMAIANNLKAGENILIVSHGFFGDRFVNLCERKGLNVDVLQSDWGDIVPLDKIDEKLASKKYSAITVTHVDTSTGVCAPVAQIGEIVKKYEDTLYIVDGVCATAGVEENMKKMNIDVLLTGSQKAFGVAPGLALVLANNKSIEKRKSLGVIPEYYVDYENWFAVMKDPSKYFATPAVNMVWAMKESVRIIKEEGLEARYERHIKNAKAMQAALEELGFKILAKKEHRAPTLSCVLYMDGINDAEFRSTLAEEGVVVAGGLGAFAGKMFRLGHMGNIDKHDLVSTISAIERTLNRVGIKDALGKGTAVLMRELEN